MLLLLQRLPVVYDGHGRPVKVPFPAGGLALKDHGMDPPSRAPSAIYGPLSAIRGPLRGGSLRPSRPVKQIMRQPET
jgi:hypothetical protein